MRLAATAVAVMSLALIVSGCLTIFGPEELPPAEEKAEETVERCLREGQYHDFTADICARIGGKMVLTALGAEEPKPVAVPVEKVESSALPDNKASNPRR